jgi:hypothetical protein
MFYFDKSDARVIFCDKRVDKYTLKDKTATGGHRELVISPDIQSDFTALPFPSNYFQMVVFDPPHFDKLGKTSWMRAKYGALEGDWRAMLAMGFSESFRVLATNGTLIFKWSSVQIPLSEILKLTEHSPVFGHISGKQSQTHWLSFVKDEA